MTNKSLHQNNNRRGSILMITAGAAFFLLAMTAMVTDVGYLYFNQARLQTAVNAGWKAGYDRMMEKSQNQSPPANSVQAEVRAHILEVMKSNGYTDAELATVNIVFGPKNHLKVASTQRVGLFFARVMDFTYSNVGAARENNALDLGQGVVPLAIPHGVIKDMSRNTYSGELFGGGSGFIPGSAYILKLGSGGGSSDVAAPSAAELGAMAGLSENEPLRMIYIPMRSGQAQPLLAYGVIFWCLRWGNDDPGTYVPVMWLLGSKADGGPDGSFITFYNANIIAQLNARGITWEAIEGTRIDELLGAATVVEMLFNRPRVAVYSNRGPGTIAGILAAANIPYGAYSLLYRNHVAYDPSVNTVLNDAAMVGAAPDSYHLILTEAFEDLTGMNYGCIFNTKCCEDMFREMRLGESTNTENQRLAVAAFMCPYCRQYYATDYAFNIDPKNKDTDGDGFNDDYPNQREKIWSSDRVFSGSTLKTWTPRYADVRANCQNLHRRCVDRVNSNNNFYFNLVSPIAARPLMCGDPTARCRSYLAQHQLATGLGYAADAGSAPKPKAILDMSGSSPSLDPMADGWFNKATPLQKLKWAVAEKLRAHVNAGGYLLAEDFSAETLELALFQSAIKAGKSVSEAYDNCLTFENFVFRLFPFSASMYSTINGMATGPAQLFGMEIPADMRCQTNGNANTSGGITNVFATSLLKGLANLLGKYSSTQVKYLKGKLGLGDFAMIGGATYADNASKRLVLNNILYASFSDKIVTGGNNLPLAGKQKSNYGPIDPDNITGGGASDYTDRFKFGFNGPLQINDRLVTETGNMRGPTDSAVDFRLNGDGTYPPSTRIIVPITDIPPEAQANQPNAKTIYDVQGKDHPNGAYTLDQYAFTSSIRIIGFAEFEIVDANDPRARVGEDYQSGDAGDLGPYQPGQVRALFVRYVVRPGDIPLQ